MMLPQRARGAESRAGNRLSNGPQRAQSKVLPFGKGLMFSEFFRMVKPSILRRLAHVSCRGYDSILSSARLFYRELRWYRG